MRLVLDIYYPDAGKFSETDHPRGQPENKGEFVKKGGQSAGGKGKQVGSAAKPKQLSMTAAHKAESRAYSEWMKEHNRLYSLYGGNKQRLASNEHLNALLLKHKAAKAEWDALLRRAEKEDETPAARARQEVERERAAKERESILATMNDGNVWSDKKIEQQFGAGAVRAVRQYVWSDKTKNNDRARKTMQAMVAISRPLPSPLTSYRSITVSPDEASHIVDVARSKGTLHLHQPESFDTSFGVSRATTLGRTGGGKQMVVLEVRAGPGIKVAWLKPMNIGTISFDEHFYGAGQELKVIGVRPYKEGPLQKYHITTEALPSSIKREQKMAARWD